MLVGVGVHDVADGNSLKAPRYSLTTKQRIFVAHNCHCPGSTQINLDRRFNRQDDSKFRTAQHYHHRFATLNVIAIMSRWY